jgi:two-component system response regulator YesN
MKGSRRSAENMFRAATGHSILEEIQTVRLNEVKRLLANPLTKIGAIAARTGYRSENFLTRLFKRATGMTPSHWRQCNK